MCVCFTPNIHSFLTIALYFNISLDVPYSTPYFFVIGIINIGLKKEILVNHTVILTTSYIIQDKTTLTRHLSPTTLTCIFCQYKCSKVREKQM